MPISMVKTAALNALADSFYYSLHNGRQVLEVENTILLVMTN